MIILTFGKHKGKALSEVPRDYLRWMAQKMDDNWGTLAREILHQSPNAGIRNIKSNNAASSSTSSSSSSNILGVKECLAALGSCNTLDQARSLFDRISPSIAALPGSSTFLLNQTMKMFGRLGGVEEAIGIFDHAYDRKDKVSWSMMFKALVDSGRYREAELLFRQMPHGVPSTICCTIMITFYGSRGFLDDAKAAFDLIEEGDVLSWNALLAAYAKQGKIDEAWQVFNLMPMWDGVSWNSLPLEGEDCGDLIKTGFDSGEAPRSIVCYNRLLLAFLRSGDSLGAESVFSKMPGRSLVSFTCMIIARAENNDIQKCEALFNAVEESRDVKLWTVMIQAYADTGHLVEAYNFFFQMPQHDTIASIELSTSLARRGCIDQVKQIFDRVPERGPRLWTSLIFGNATSGKHSEVETTFRLMPQWDLASSTCVIAAHKRSGNLKAAEEIFRTCREHSIISWNKMLEVYSWNANQRALHLLLEKMPMINEATLTMILSSPTMMRSAAREVFQNLPGHCGFSWTCLIAIHARHGRLDEATSLLMNAPMWDLPMWNSLMIGHCKDGRVGEALEIFQLMNLVGMLLDGFSHVAKREAARTLFLSIQPDYGIQPNFVHYTCMIDLLGRSGHLDDAEELAESMPFVPDVVVWQVLLGSCRNRKDSARARRILERILELDPMRASSHVLAANTFREGGGESDVKMIREAMIGKGMRRVPGVSLVQIGNEVHRFVVGDSSHPRIDEIHEKLDSLSSLMKKAGYKPRTGVTMISGSERDKEELLCRHSEKLALGWALIATEPGSRVEISKNLRMCYDCHDATALISGIVSREIVVRDANRLHRFQNGSCSCAGLW